ncbi:hypothetical protein L1987_24086 [Smallanthus sonchifolius]|uniref:Uncharacterized protein n=1 Tax=Smallanthus sonchifolius TaxID=185202 RepID=A0ACB9IKX6_9ASTR|nr:hypothetical protein L1987_24086 [Smallanthus sonchifolius]
MRGAATSGGRRGLGLGDGGGSGGGRPGLGLKWTARSSSKSPLSGSLITDDPLQRQIERLSEERKALIKGQYWEKNTSLLVQYCLPLVYDSIGGGVNTYLRRGKLFPGPIYLLVQCFRGQDGTYRQVLQGPNNGTFSGACLFATKPSFSTDKDENILAYIVECVSHIVDGEERETLAKEISKDWSSVFELSIIISN